MAQLNVNGTLRNCDAEPETPLLWVLREQLGLTGTKYGCGVAQCGSCTVHLDGAPVRSCVLPVAAVQLRGRWALLRRKLPLIAAYGLVPVAGTQLAYFNAVATLLRPTSGTLRVAGIDVLTDPKRVRRVIGLAGQSASVEPAMTGRENLEMVARLFGLDKLYDVPGTLERLRPAVEQVL